MNEMKIIYEYTKQENGLLKRVDFHHVNDISEVPLKEDIIYEKEQIIYELDVNGNNTDIIKEVINPYPTIKEKIRLNWVSESDYQYAKLINDCVFALTNEEMKIYNLIPLEQGEKIVDGELVILTQPNRCYSWINEEWVFDNDKFESEKISKFNYLKEEREKTLETGILFEKNKLIKGRTQDLADAMAVVDLFQTGVTKTYWFYSNGVTEEVDKNKMMVIYQAIGNFRSSQFGKEAQLKSKIMITKTLEELEDMKW